MALMDGLNLFSGAPPVAGSDAWTGQSLNAGSPGDIVSTNQIALGTNNAIVAPFAGGARDLGIGDNTLRILVKVVVSLASGTSVDVKFQGSVDNAAWTTYASSGVILTAAATAGTTLWDSHVPRRIAGAAKPRFYRIVYTTLGTFTGLGAVIAGLVVHTDSNAAADTYAAGLTIAN